MKYNKSIIIAVTVLVLIGIAIASYGIRFQANVLGTGSDAVCTQRMQELGCETFTCKNNACSCVEEAENTSQDQTDNRLRTFANESKADPISQKLMLLEKKILFNQPYAYGCDVQNASGPGEKNYLFNNLRTSMDGKTLFTTEYQGASFFRLDDTFMNIEYTDSIDFWDEPEWNDGGDCGTPRSLFGYNFGNDDYGIIPKDGFTGQAPSPLLHINNDEFEVIGSVPPRDEEPAYGEKEEKYFHMFVGKNNKRYAMASTSTVGEGAFEHVKIYDVTDFNNPILVKEVVEGTTLDTLLKTAHVQGFLDEENNAFTPSRYAKITNSPYVIFGLEEKGRLNIYDMTNAMNLVKLASVPKPAEEIKRYGLVRVQNTIYRIVPSGGVGNASVTVYKFEIGLDDNFTQVIEVPVSISQMRISSDHMLFTMTSSGGYNMRTINAYNLKMGKKKLYNIKVPVSYAEYGYMMEKSPMRDWAVTRQGDNYYIYTISGASVQGGPNYIEALKFGIDGSGTYVDNTCTPDCSMQYACGQSDGCGLYCRNTMVNGEGSRGCQEGSCFPANYQPGRLNTGTPSCYDRPPL